MTGLYNIYQDGFYSMYAFASFCKLAPHLCNIIDEGYGNYNGTIDNMARLPVKFMHTPAGCGWRNLMHYAQIIWSGKFQRYDFGLTGNYVKYRRSTPPEYDLSKINVKMAVAHGDLDRLANTKDVNWLLDQKRSGLNVKDLLVYNATYHFGHGTFMLAQNMSYFSDDFMPIIKE